MGCWSDIALCVRRRNQLAFCLFIVSLYSPPFEIALPSCSGVDFAISKGLSVLYQLAIKGYHAWARTFDEGKRALPEEHLKQEWVGYMWVGLHLFIYLFNLYF